MDKIVEINTSDFNCTVEPGVTYETLNQHLHTTGLWFPGGMFARNYWAAGFRERSMIAFGKMFRTERKNCRSGCQCVHMRYGCYERKWYKCSAVWYNGAECFEFGSTFHFLVQFLQFDYSLSFFCFNSNIKCYYRLFCPMVTCYTQLGKIDGQGELY